MKNSETIAERVARLQSAGIIDLHFDLPMDLYEKRQRKDVLANDFLTELKQGEIGLIAAAIYIEDRYLPNDGLRVGLDQVARLCVEVENSPHFAICRSFREIEAARAANKIAIVLAMEGAEPLGDDPDLLRVFYELGVRIIGLTHARKNAAAHGGIFAASGSSPEGLTEFGRDLVSECERLGIILDLAHINPAGFDEILQLTKKPPIVTHSNARRFYDIERNLSDEQIRAVGQRGGVIGVNSILVSPKKEGTTLDRYVDHIEHMIGLIGIDGVAIGFDFCEFIFRQWPEEKLTKFQQRVRPLHFIPELTTHAHAGNLTRKLIERGFEDEQIEKILYRNWRRILEELL